MADIDIRRAGKAGRITMTRPQALNAMSYDMCMEIDAALKIWREDDAIEVIVFDAEGDKAFCAGGDIAELYATGTKGDFGYGRTFWHDEYRMNAMISDYPKPVVSFLQGFTMGGGVGIGCHGTHRVVDDSSRIAMPECGIGLLPDVGGCHFLASAPGFLGEYIGLTAGRMGPDDAIYAGFADHYIPRDQWADLIALIEASGDATHVERAATNAPEGLLRKAQAQIDGWFDQPDLAAIKAALQADDSDLAAKTLKSISHNSPLSMACTKSVLRQLRAEGSTVKGALSLEYRFTWRSMEHGDFLEGIRAQIIDKDRNPNWRHRDLSVPNGDVDMMLADLGPDALTFD